MDIFVKYGIVATTFDSIHAVKYPSGVVVVLINTNERWYPYHHHWNIAGGKTHLVMEIGERGCDMYDKKYHEVWIDVTELRKHNHFIEQEKDQLSITFIPHSVYKGESKLLRSIEEFNHGTDR